MKTKKNENTILIIISLITLLIMSSMNAFSLPQLPTEFYGEVYFGNAPAPAGVRVTAYSGAILCGSFNVIYGGFYGVLSCNTDDPETPQIEGGQDSDTISFFINNITAIPRGDNIFYEGAFKRVDLVPCGDNYCDRNVENCVICEHDCGICPLANQTPPVNMTNITNVTGGGGSTGGGSGSGTGSGTGGGGGGGGTSSPKDSKTNPDNKTIEINPNDIPINITVCKENWSCAEWDVCLPNSTQYRICKDTSSCNTTSDKPIEVQECVYEGDCFDRIQNGLETNIDCGGSCKPCIGQENEPNCYDGFKNCHSGYCEAGIDCEGPCEKECKKKQPQLEIPIKICKREFDFKDPAYWLFLMIVIAAIILDSVYTNKRIKKIRKDDKQDDVLRAKKWLSLRRTFFLFAALIVILYLAFSLYYYYFSQCSTVVTNIFWIIIFIFVLVPLTIFSVLKVTEYDDKVRVKKLLEFLESHHSNIKRLIQMENEYLIELENELSNDMYQLLKDDTFKGVIEKFPQLKIVYKDMISLYDEYKNKKNPYSVEKELCVNIYDLENNEDFKRLASEYPRIKHIYSTLLLLYKQYEEKQRLYEMLEDKEHNEDDVGDKKVDDDSKKPEEETKSRWE